MLFSHVACAVESFRVASDRPGAFGDEILVEGWFLTHAPIRAMQVRFGDGTVLEVGDRRRASDGLVPHYGGSFGEDARRGRFLLVEPVGLRAWDFASAIFCVESEDGGAMSWPIGSLYQPPRASEFSAEEASLVMSFESLGDNCEFGLVQRRVGRERLSFLRYAGVGEVEALARSIADGLAVFDQPDTVAISVHGNEWIAGVPALRLAFHTGRAADSIPLERIRVEETRKLAFMAQKFVEDCETGEKIFVYRVLRDERGGPDGTRGMIEMFDALRRHGPARLLWVNEEDAAHPHGTIEQVRDGLFRGWIDHLAPHSDAFDFRPRSWLDLLRRATERMSA